jgi:hypothetical protein
MHNKSDSVNDKEIKRYVDLKGSKAHFIQHQVGIDTDLLELKKNYTKYNKILQKIAYSNDFRPLKAKRRSSFFGFTRDASTSINSSQRDANSSQRDVSKTGLAAASAVRFSSSYVYPIFSLHYGEISST